MRVRIETERLIIRNLVPEDAEDAFRWCGDPEVNKYMIYTLYQSVDQVRSWISSRNPDDPDEYDLGFELKETGKVIGCGGFVYHAEEDIWVIGYNLAREYWGRGYVPEAMQGLLEHIMSEREVRAIEGVFCEENHKSQRVMEKLGMSYYQDTEYTKMDGSKTFKAKMYRKEF